MWSSKMLVRRWVEAVVLLLTAAIVLETWLVAGLLTPIVVQGESMLPTLAPGRRILVNRAALYFSHPRRWQLAVFRCPENASALCVKRIVGLPHETVEIRDGRLWIDGREPDSSAQPAYEFAPIGQPAQYRLAGNEYFLLGDHPSDSIDSRSWRPSGISPKLFIGSLLCWGNQSGASADRSGSSTSEPVEP